MSSPNPAPSQGGSTAPGRSAESLNRDRVAATHATRQPRRHRIFVRGPWEMLASILIGTGVVMLMQPFTLWAYSWSFAVLLTGTVMFLVVSHFPE